MIQILDYGVGNVKSIVNAYRRLGIKCITVRDKMSLNSEFSIVLPGVGDFDVAMKKFNSSGLRDHVEELVIEQKVPVLGICVGMQMMGKCSEEGKLPGLNWIKGRTIKIPSGEELSPLPHMGWNTLKPWNAHLLTGLPEVQKSEFYFLHSYYFKAKDPKDVIARSFYNTDLDVIVGSENKIGIQFHPEKSFSAGARVLEMFARL